MRSRSWQVDSDSTVERNRWTVPWGISNSPPREMSGFIRSTPRRALSSLTLELSTAAACPQPQHEPGQVPRVPVVQPSSPAPTSSMSPKRSNTAKVSSCLRTRVRSSIRAEVERCRIHPGFGPLPRSSALCLRQTVLGAPCHQMFIDLHIVACHAGRGETRSNTSRHPFRLSCPTRSTAATASGFRNDEAAPPVFHHLGHRAVPVGDYACRRPWTQSSPARTARPVDGNSRAQALPRNSLLSVSPIPR